MFWGPAIFHQIGGPNRRKQNPFTFKGSAFHCQASPILIPPFNLNPWSEPILTHPIEFNLNLGSEFNLNLGSEPILTPPIKFILRLGSEPILIPPIETNLNLGSEAILIPPIELQSNLKPWIVWGGTAPSYTK